MISAQQHGTLSKLSQNSTVEMSVLEEPHSHRTQQVMISTDMTHTIDSVDYPEEEADPEAPVSRKTALPSLKLHIPLCVQSAEVMQLFH